MVLVRHRTGFLALLAAVAALFAAGARPAAADWDYSNEATGSTVEAYTSEASVLPGQTVHFHVSTNPAAPYRIFIYRLGAWDGFAPPLLGCAASSCDSTSQGVARAQPAPDPTTGEVNAGWPVTDTFTVPSSWRSGYYVAKVVRYGAPQSEWGKLVPFIVREPVGHKATVLVQAAVNTWQAYNDWGGASLYQWPGGSRSHAVKVSFDRPYSAVDVGSQSLFDWELQLARFLEFEGYDVAYTTDRDVDADPSLLLGHKLVISAGHDEYWTGAQRTAFEQARDAGVNLMFAGANDSYWQVRYEDGGRTMVGYKDLSADDPEAGAADETTKFRLLSSPRPECLLQGIESNGGLENGGGFTEGIANDALTDPTYDSWFAGTGFTTGTTFTNLVGYEWDQIMPGCTPDQKPGTSLTALFHSTADGTRPQDAAVYTAPSGARVLSTGSFQFSWGLDGYGLNANPGRQPPDPGLQQFTRNMLNDLAGPAIGATTGTVGSVGSSGARLGGTVTPNGAATAYHFDYGPTIEYGQSTAEADAGAGTAAVAAGSDAAGLSPSTTYHYRLVAVTGGLARYGADSTFTTAAPPPAPGASGSPSSSPSASPAQSGPVTGSPPASVLPGAGAAPPLGAIKVPHRLSLGRALAHGIPVTVDAPVAGSRVRVELRLRKSLVASVVSAAGHGTTVKLTLKLKRSARRRLAHAHSIVIRISVTPPGAAAVTASRTVQLAK